MFRKRGSIRVTVLLALIVLFITLFSMSAWLFYNNSEKNIEMHVDQYQKMLLDNTKLRLDNFMEKPHLMNLSLLNEIKKHKEMMNDFPFMRKTFIEYLVIYDSVMAGAMGIESNGNFISAGRTSEGGFTSAFHQKEVSPIYYLLNDERVPETLITTRDSYNVHERSWYKKGKMSKKAAWSSVYTFKANMEIGLTAVLPVYIDGEFMGVLQSAFSLSFINNFLKDITREGNHRIFILDDKRLLVGHSGKAPVISRDSEGELHRLGGDVQDEIIHTLFTQELLFSDKSRENSIPFLIGDEKYFLRTLNYSGEHDLNWIICVADIQKDFAGNLKQVLWKNLIISIFTGIVAVLISFMMLYKAVKTIKRLNKSVRLFTSDYNILFFPGEGPGELKELTEGFYIMSRKILNMKHSLEDKVQERTRELEQSLKKIKTLSGLVPICSKCKKIRDDKGFWNHLETYIESHTDALFTHGLCRECEEELYGNEKWYKNRRKGDYV